MSAIIWALFIILSIIALFVAYYVSVWFIKTFLSLLPVLVISIFGLVLGINAGGVYGGIIIVLAIITDFIVHSMWESSELYQKLERWFEDSTSFYGDELDPEVYQARKAEVEAQLEAMVAFDSAFTEKEIQYLCVLLNEGEVIQALTSGFLDGDSCLIAVTDRRIVFIDKGLTFGNEQVEIPLSQVCSISCSTGLMFGDLDIQTAGGSITAETIDKKDVVKVANIISGLVGTVQDSEV